VTRDAIDDIVDWQLLRRHKGPAVVRHMVSVIDDDEQIVYKSARWTPTRGWIPSAYFDDLDHEEDDQ